ncbi:unnamed protein product, partial [Polarella glacialis]
MNANGAKIKRPVQATVQPQAVLLTKQDLEQLNCHSFCPPREITSSSLLPGATPVRLPSAVGATSLPGGWQPGLIPSGRGGLPGVLGSPAAAAWPPQPRRRTRSASARPQVAVPQEGGPLGFE